VRGLEAGIVVFGRPGMLPLEGSIAPIAAFMATKAAGGPDPSAVGVGSRPKTGESMVRSAAPVDHRAPRVARRVTSIQDFILRVAV
jgi:hypothetical protein